MLKTWQIIITGMSLIKSVLPLILLIYSNTSKKTMTMIIRLQIANLILFRFIILFWQFARQVTKAHTCSSRKVGNYWLPRFTFGVVSKPRIFK